MTEACRNSAAPEISDLHAALVSLRNAGAHHFDPMRLHYLETLAQHTTNQAANVQRLLNTKLAQALADFKTRFEMARAQAVDAIARTAVQDPQAQVGLQRLLDAGDFAEVRRSVKALSAHPARESLTNLVRSLEQAAPEKAPSGFEATLGARRELKSVQKFRNTWSKLSVDRQVTQALHLAPDQAGPINSHMLVLRSLTLMRDISPDYLNRFMSYVDTLLSLDPGEGKKPAPAKEVLGADNSKKKANTRRVQGR